MTEDEAKTKWCPMVRVMGNSTSGNRLLDNTLAPGSLCIASSCMMWVTHTEWNEAAAEFLPRDPTQGTCGLKYSP